MKSVTQRHELQMAQTLTNEIIDAAIEGFEAQRRRIDDRIAELRSMRNGSSAASPSKGDTAPRKRKFSPDAIRRMREAQQQRWAKVRGEAGPSTPGASQPAKKKRRLSPQGRKAIQEALRRRWAQKRADAAAPKPATNKTATKTTKAAATSGKRAPKKKAASKPAPTTAPASA
jgi:hypothetical protein